MRPVQDQASDRPKKMTYEEFLDWCDEDTLAEWVAGEVVMYSPASMRHQVVVDFLITVLTIYVEQRGWGLVLSGPFQMKTGPDLPGREPDVLFIVREHLEKLGHAYLDGPGDLVVEVVSRESRLRDRGEKLAEYEMGGVREYWLLDPERQQADFYVLGPDGRYERKRPDEQGIYRASVVAGFWLREEWLWQEPPPKALTVLKELGVV